MWIKSLNNLFFFLPSLNAPFSNNEWKLACSDFQKCVFEKEKNLKRLVIFFISSMIDL